LDVDISTFERHKNIASLLFLVKGGLYLAADLQLGMSLNFNIQSLQQLDNITKKVKEINQSVKQASTVINQYATTTQSVNKQVGELSNTYGKLVKTVREGEVHTKKWTATYRDSEGVITQVSNKLNQHGEILKRTTKEVKTYGDSFSDVIGRNLSKMLSWGLAAGILYGGLRKLTEGFQTLTEFDVNRVNILKVLDKNVDFTPFERGAKIISQQYGVAVKDVTTAMQTWARQVKDTNAVIMLTNASMKAVAVTDITLESSFKSLSAIMSQFKLEVADSFHIVDSFNELSNNMRTTAEDVAQGLAKTGSAAKLMGIDFDRAAAMVATMVEVTGTTGSQAGTILNRMFSRIHAEETVKTLKELSINAFQPLKTTLDQIGLSWNKYSKSEQEAIAKSLGGMHHWNKVMSLFNNYDRVIEATLMSYNSLGSANKEIELSLSTFNKKVEQLNASFQALVISGGNNLMPTLKAIIDGFRSLITMGDSIIPKLAAVAVAVYGVRTALLMLNNSTKVTSGGILAVITILTTLTAALIGFQSSAQFVDRVNNSIAKMGVELSDAEEKIRHLGYLGDIYDKLSNKINTLDKNSKEYISTNKLLEIATRQVNEMSKQYNVTVQNSGNVRTNIQRQIQQLITKIKEEEKEITKSTIKNIDNSIEIIDAEIKKTEILLRLSRNRMEQYQKETSLLGKMKFFMLMVFDPNLWKFFSESVMKAQGKNIIEKMSNALKGLWDTINLEFDPVGATKKFEDKLNELKNDRNQLVRNREKLKLGDLLGGFEEDSEFDEPKDETLAEKIQKIKDTLANELTAINNQATAYRNLGIQYDAVAAKVDAYNNAMSGLSKLAPNDNALFEWAKQLASLKPQEIMNQLATKMAGIQEQFAASGDKAQFYKEQINAIEFAIKAIASVDGKSPFLETLRQQLQDVLKLVEGKGGKLPDSVASQRNKSFWDGMENPLNTVATAMANFNTESQAVALTLKFVSIMMTQMAAGATAATAAVAALQAVATMGISLLVTGILGAIFGGSKSKQPRYKEEKYEAHTAYIQRQRQNARLVELAQLNQFQNAGFDIALINGELVNVSNRIRELTNSIKKSIDEWNKALGISINDIASNLENAFQADNYMSFLNDWNQNLYETTRTALIRGFLAQGAMQQLYKNLSNTIGIAVLDGTLSAEEISAIRGAGNAVAQKMQVLYQALGLLDGAFPGANQNSGGGQSYSAGSSVPLTINNYISINTSAFMGDEDDAREFALLMRDYIVSEEQRS
jgi:TP901 family phage tail tape measure protein